MALPKISVIVPVYNTEAYLERCLQSVVSQTWENTEIILVDDGSKDGSGARCDQWRGKDGRILVIHKENGGLGLARNSGLEVASGDYVIFVDSDDYLETDALERAQKRIEETGADACYYGMTEQWTDGTSRNGTPPDKLLYEGEKKIEFIKESLGREAHSNTVLFAGVSACTVMLRRAFLEKNGLVFHSERRILCEDLLFNLQVCFRAGRIAVEPRSLYHYCHNDSSSLTQRYRADRLGGALRLYHKLTELAEEEGVEPVLRLRIKRSFMNNFILCLKQEVRYQKIHGIRKTYGNLKTICCNENVQKILKEYPLNQLPMKQKLLFKGVKGRRIVLVWLLVWLQEKTGLRQNL